MTDACAGSGASPSGKLGSVDTAYPASSCWGAPVGGLSSCGGACDGGCDRDCIAFGCKLGAGEGP